MLNRVPGRSQHEPDAGGGRNETRAHPAFPWLDDGVGSWDVSVQERTVGTDRVRTVLAGCAITQDRTTARGSRAHSRFCVEPVGRAWRRVWVAENALARGGPEEKRMIGMTPDDGVRFQGAIVPEGGGSYLDRTTRTPAGPDRVRQVSEVSTDGGASWRAAFDAVCRRAMSAPSASGLRLLAGAVPVLLLPLAAVVAAQVPEEIGSVVRHDTAPRAGVLFRDDFEAGLARWDDRSRGNATVVATGEGHGQVLRLAPDGDVRVLIPGSERWDAAVVEGEFLFPEAGDAYLGLIYHYRESRGRADFGQIYIKSGRRAYLQPNPHRDDNVMRTFYPELEAPLSGDAAVRPGEWQRFRMEVAGGVAHVYIGPGSVPQLTFRIPEPGRGRLGFQPRSVGEPVLLDNIVVRQLARHTYQGPPVPAPAYEPGHALRWESAGPFDRTRDSLVAGAGSDAGWRPFEADPRGAIETARLIDFHGPNTVAYFRTIVRTGAAGPATLRLSSVDDVALWVNGRFEGFYGRQERAWYDHDRNAAHAGLVRPVRLREGRNVIALRVRGGTYAAGGFFASLDHDTQ